MTRLLLSLAALVCAVQVVTGVTMYRSDAVEDSGDVVASVVVPAALAAVLLGTAAMLRWRGLAVGALVFALIRVGCGLPGAFVVLDGGRPLDGFAAAAEVVADALVLPLIVVALVLSRRSWRRGSRRRREQPVISGAPGTPSPSGKVSSAPEIANRELRRASPA
ncbi:lysylphosphatidylglycerol synthetase-like protein (DUF2156 family) [Hamadaea flava]|uniref:Uncharacterized protein n=1 Tax=Hamadaea flava TaxID=1742688 RepID=A0ABV8M043_9ACTN|nr:hypothetical protein [Hamadaea flava]MCP2321940.1 lysylphosphatidylglycerol synthetase-like protein (DUF2156 family) [Hamadaea flava]